ncbi:serine hydrolase [Allobranchiibius huperziae]|uniref:Beta-lactamase class A catalytic domain-containing protein n=1 Tax=Allobranchiibius huperziae TaxID=1874116 RepID=A0A853DIU0_9MICO|nr:serine hydrolase [Allobranchiibius huperziae]NYJ74105.1 hypothetical protein [Allobranchiibius huperziae]
MGDVYVRRRLVVGSGAAALVGLIAWHPLRHDGRPNTAVSTGSSSGATHRKSTSASRATATRTDPGILTRALDAALGARAGDVSVTAYDRRSSATFSYHPAMTNVCASIMKVLILTSVSHTRRAAGGSLTASDRDLAEDMITESDNDAATELYRRGGGAPAAQRVANALGMMSTRPNVRWGLTTTTAPDQVMLVRALAYGHSFLDNTDRAYIFDLMGRVDPGQKFGIGTLPAGVKGVAVQVKNGWLPYNPGSWHDNSIGHVQGAGRDYAAAILSTRNATDAAGRALITKAAAVLYTHLGH